MPRRLFLLGVLQNRHWEEKYSRDSTEDQGTVYKEYIDKNDIDEWKKDEADDEAWARFVHDNAWSYPLRFASSQLRKRTPKPILNTGSDENLYEAWKAGGNRVMTQPLAA